MLKSLEICFHWANNMSRALARSQERSRESLKGYCMNRVRSSILFCLVLGVVFFTWGFAPVVQAKSPKTTNPETKPGVKSGQATAGKPDQTPVLETQKNRVSYAIGVNMIGNLRRRESTTIWTC